METRITLSEDLEEESLFSEVYLRKLRVMSHDAPAVGDEVSKFNCLSLSRCLGSMFTVNCLTVGTIAILWL
jgi:hypothetical protein